jgi:hypothetical protein
MVPKYIITLASHTSDECQLMAFVAVIFGKIATSKLKKE